MVLKGLSKSLSSSKVTTGLSNDPMPAAGEVFGHYGKHVFTGALADHYLKKNGGSGAMLEDSTWVSDRSKADIVAAAVLEW